MCLKPSQGGESHPLSVVSCQWQAGIVCLPLCPASGPSLHPCTSVSICGSPLRSVVLAGALRAWWFDLPAPNEPTTQPLPCILRILRSPAPPCRPSWRSWRLGGSNLRAKRSQTWATWGNWVTRHAVCKIIPRGHLRRFGPALLPNHRHTIKATAKLRRPFRHRRRPPLFVIRASGFIRHSDFVIRAWVMGDDPLRAIPVARRITEEKSPAAA
jgi:hypothetical protein